MGRWGASPAILGGIMGTLADILASGALEGYRPGSPPGHLGGPDIDRDVCREARCCQCGHEGLDYRPFTRPGSYRAFAVCPNCQTAQEF